MQSTLYNGLATVVTTSGAMLNGTSLAATSASKHIHHLHHPGSSIPDPSSLQRLTQQQQQHNQQKQLLQNLLYAQDVPQVALAGLASVPSNGAIAPPPTPQPNSDHHHHHHHHPYSIHQQHQAFLSHPHLLPLHTPSSATSASLLSQQQQQQYSTHDYLEPSTLQQQSMSDSNAFDFQQELSSPTGSSTMHSDHNVYASRGPPIAMQQPHMHTIHSQSKIQRLNTHPSNSASSSALASPIQPGLLGSVERMASESEMKRNLIREDYNQINDPALRACEELGSIYNRMMKALSHETELEITARVALRQDLCEAVAALDKTFFLSPSGLGYIGFLSEPNNSTRKRAFTLGNGDGDETKKHRRTGSDNTFSDGSGPSTSFIPSRPALFQHTHSSPLLPVETHYRPGASGISDAIPATKAADLAASGSHRVGRLTLGSLSMSTITGITANEGMVSQHAYPDHQQQTESHELFETAARTPLASPADDEQHQHQPAILAPTPQHALAMAAQVNTSLESAIQHAPQLQQHQQQSQPMDPQKYAQQALRNQQIQLAMQQQAVVAAQAAAAGIQSSHIDLVTSQSNTPIPFYSQSDSLTAASAYNTPPLRELSQFTTQYLDVDMSASKIVDHQVPSALASETMSTLKKQAARPSLSELDFTTMRSGKEEEMLLTSPFASSQASASSFPFTSNSGTGTSGSRSRATSISRNTSAPRSRAPSTSSISQAFAPEDAHEIENILGSLTTLPSPINEDDDDDLFYDNQQSGSNENGGPLAFKKDIIAPELVAAYNDIFHQWITRICSDLEAVDRKGEKIHQPLMAKKMAKMDEERLFRPFKFRIQPFTNSFQDACRDLGMSEQDVAPKLIKHYLWNQPLISRFNDEGKKTKSKGNHVWSVEARLVDVGAYEFRQPQAKIIPVPATAAPGIQFGWTPKVLDSSCQGSPMDADFSCPNLPPWLQWNGNSLQGVPPDNASSICIDIVAQYQKLSLTQNITIAVVAEDGVRALASDSIAMKSGNISPTYAPPQHTPTSSIHSSFSNPKGSDMTGSTSSLATPPSYLSQTGSNGVLMPSPMTHMSQEQLISPTHLPKLQTHHMRSLGSAPASPISPQQPTFPSFPQTQSIPFYLPTHPTDVTTLASASHIKAKLVEQTTVHHENLSTLNPAHRPADPAKVSAAVDAAINHQIAVTAQVPCMPSASEVFNATLEVSARSQQMQQAQLNHAVAVVTSQMQHTPTPSVQAQVTSQLADFSFVTPSTTPSNCSPDDLFQARQLGA